MVFLAFPEIAAAAAEVVTIDVDFTVVSTIVESADVDAAYAEVLNVFPILVGAPVATVGIGTAICYMTVGAYTFQIKTNNCPCQGRCQVWNGTECVPKVCETGSLLNNNDCNCYTFQLTLFANPNPAIINVSTISLETPDIIENYYCPGNPANGLGTNYYYFAMDYLGDNSSYTPPAGTEPPTFFFYVAIQGFKPDAIDVEVNSGPNNGTIGHHSVYLNLPGGQQYNVDFVLTPSVDLVYNNFYNFESAFVCSS